MDDLERRVNALDIKFATTAQQFISLHEDNKQLLKEVGRLNDKLTAINLQFSQGKGLIIGITMVLGSLFTIINQFFFK